MRLAYVDESEIVFPVELGFHFSNCDISGHGNFLLFLWNAAKFLIVDQFVDSRMFAANGAFGVFPQLEFAELHVQRVIKQQTAFKRLADTQDELYSFCSLNE